MVQYLTIEVQNRADGINNIQPIVARNSLATGLSYYYERCAAMAATTLYPTVTLVLMDTDGRVYENKHLTTAYQPEPTE